MTDKVINLKHSIPVKEGDQVRRVNELKMGRLKVKHLRSLPDDFAAGDGKIKPIDVIPLIASVANIPIESADEIDFEDLEAVSDAITDFLTKSLPTGKK